MGISNADRINEYIKEREEELLSKVRKYIREIDEQKEIINSEYYGKERERALEFLEQDKKRFIDRLVESHTYDIRREIFNLEGE